MTNLVHVQEELGVVTITLDSPANRNALSAQLRRELRDALTDAGRSRSARVVVLTHTGPTFCSGMDLRENAGATSATAGVRELPGLLQLIAGSGQPVIAVVRGPARAGGIGLLAAADVVVAAEAATFAFSEVRIGLIPAVISVPLLRRVTATAARELLLTGAVFDAARALQIGLVNAVAAPDELDAVVERYLEYFRRGAPGALAGTKQMLAMQHDDSDERYDQLLEMSAGQFASPEGQEGGRAFVEKRSPSWFADA